MLLSELIKELQSLKKDFEKYRYYEGKDILGPPQIFMDFFKKSNTGHYMKFSGLTGEFKIELDQCVAGYVLQGADWNS
jgi:hypothetical protein